MTIRHIRTATNIFIFLASLVMASLFSSCSEGGRANKNLSFVADSLNHQLQAERRLNQKYQYYINQVLPKLDKSLNSEELVSITVSTPGDLNAQVAYPTTNSSSTSSARVAPSQLPQMKHVARFEYRPGSSKLTDGMREALQVLADTLKNSEKYLIMIEGHTDPTEAKNDPRIIDGWVLSGERSSEVARFLLAKGVYPHMMVAAGRSNFKPVSSLDTEKGNAKNRRVDIFLLPSTL